MVLMDDDADHSEQLPPAVSKYAGDMSEALITELNLAVETLSNLTIARAEEPLVNKLGRNLQPLQKWSARSIFTYLVSNPSSGTI